MAEEKKIDEIERLLKELKASEVETAVTIEEVEGRPFGFWRVGKAFFSVWRKSFIAVALVILLLIVALPFVTFFILKQGSTLHGTERCIP